MIILPLLLFPFLLALSVWRLSSIAMRLRSGSLQCVALRARPLLWLATWLAYLMLLAYTCGLCAAVIYALWQGHASLAGYAPLLVWVLIYPLVYFLAAWVFYYGLREPEGTRSIAVRKRP